MNSRKLVGVLLLMALMLAGQVVVPAHAAAAVRYVKPGGMTTGTCNSWANGCELTYALNTVAASGDSIWAKGGVYLPFAGTNRSASFILRNGIAIYGGFLGNETQLSQRKPTVYFTFLSGDTGVSGDSSDNAYHVVKSQGANSTAILDGFAITGGNANGVYPDNTGGGMYNFNSDPTLANLVFLNNTGLQGGGMGNEYFSNPSLSRVGFVNNTATAGNGGGMLNQESQKSSSTGPILTLTDVAFHGNSASGGGGGMANVNYSFPVVNRVTFSGNSAAAGAGIYDSYSAPVLTNVTFNGNTASGNGGAMRNEGLGNPSLLNVTVSGNTAASGGGMSNDTGSSPVIKDSIFWNNGTEIVTGTGTPNLTDSIVAGGCPSPGTCSFVFNSDPLLGALAQNGGLTQTMALLPGSAAINAGGGHSTCAPIDQRGVPRPQGPACDIGAYEYASVSISGNAGAGGVTLSYVDGGAKTVTSNVSTGVYSIVVPWGWTGTVTPTLTDHVFVPTHRNYAGVAGNQVNQDYTTYVGFGTYDDTSAYFTYSTGWTPISIAGTYNNTAHLASVLGSTASFTFYGTGFTLTYGRWPGFGLINVFLDGNPTPLTTIVANAATGSLGTYPSPVLAVGPHTVVFQDAFAAAPWIAIDKLVITP